MTEALPLVSVLIPIYNHGRYVEQCLRSIEEQDYPEVELLAIDDGSTDDSFEVATRFLETHGDRFRRWELVVRENRGLNATLDELVKRCSGEVLIPIASDDMLTPGSITRRMQLFQANPQMQGLATDCGVIDGAGSLIADSGVKHLYKGNPAALRYRPRLALSLLLNWCIPGPSIALRRNAFGPNGCVGSYADLGYPEDLDLYLRLASEKKIWFESDCLASYRLHGSNISRLRTDLMHQGNEATIRRLLPRLSSLDRLAARLILIATSGRPLAAPAARTSLWVARRIWPPIAVALAAVQDRGMRQS